MFLIVLWFKRFSSFALFGIDGNSFFLWDLGLPQIMDFRLEFLGSFSNN
jgi:hypothetical protein